MKLSNAHIVPTIPVTELEEAKRFYGDKLGLDLYTENCDRGRRLYEACDGTHVLVCQRRTLSVPDATTMTLLVKELSQTADWLRDRGSSFEASDMPRMGIKTRRGIADMNGNLAARFKDPGGNILVTTEIKVASRVLAGEWVGAAVASQRLTAQAIARGGPQLAGSLSAGPPAAPPAVRISTPCTCGYTPSAPYHHAQFRSHMIWSVSRKGLK